MTSIRVINRDTRNVAMAHMVLLYSRACNTRFVYHFPVRLLGVGLGSNGSSREAYVSYRVHNRPNQRT